MINEQPVFNSASLRVRGKLGFSAGVGFARCGYSRAGCSKDFGGYYQIRHRKRGTFVTRLRYYKPPNAQTETQQTWRSVFADGVQAWKDLTTEDKIFYNSLKYPRGQSGFTRFMSKYLAQHYPPDRS